MKIRSTPDHIRNLLQDGESHQAKILSILKSWPIGEYSRRIDLTVMAADEQQIIATTIERFERWVEAVVRHRALYDRRRLKQLSQLVKSALTDDDYKEPAIEDAEMALTELLLSVTSIPVTNGVERRSTTAIQKDTAFIIMAFGRRPNLQDTCNTIKRVCKLHGFDAFRADDFHDGIVIERIHELISTAEIVIGDLSLERPNVYYEIGVANGKAKEPILFRRRGTKLPFNLAAYHVPEYRSYAELESLLANRLRVLRN